jgi:hypothetical protein
VIEASGENHRTIKDPGLPKSGKVDPGFLNGHLSGLGYECFDCFLSSVFHEVIGEIPVEHHAPFNPASPFLACSSLWQAGCIQKGPSIKPRPSASIIDDSD